MKNATPDLQVRIHGIDGSTRTFIQNDPDLVNRTLHELDPTRILTQDRITIADEHSAAAFLPPLVTRVDLITDRLSVWDFPFAIGALVELTETEFLEHLHGRQRPEPPHLQGDFPVFLDIEMVNGQHTLLWMEIIAGLPTERLLSIYSLLKERHLIFGLRTNGIGVLNLANMVRFLVHPKPPEAKTVAGLASQENGHQRPGLIENPNHQRTTNGKPHYEQHLQTQKGLHTY